MAERRSSSLAADAVGRYLGQVSDHGLLDAEDEVRLARSIEAGKKADIVVLDSNLFEIQPTGLSDVRVLLTLLDGEPIYEAGIN